MSTSFLEIKEEFPSRFVELKRLLVPNGEAQARLTVAWADILQEIATSTTLFEERRSEGSSFLIPQVDFTELTQLSSEVIANIRKRGCVLIKNVVDDEQAVAWKQGIKDYITANPAFPGIPEDNKEFYFMYWSKPQVQARAHRNVRASQKWLNSLYHMPAPRDGVSTEIPLAYADKLRIREPGYLTWLISVPHIDGASIERWEDPGCRRVYKQIIEGNWRSHDPYDLEARLDANTDMYDMPHQASVFRSFQGWLAMSDTGPNEGTLQDVVLSNAYIILRPFFRPVTSPASNDPLDPNNWEFDTSSPDFPGIYPGDGVFKGPWLTKNSHPHLKLDKAMVSMPRVKPGDMVFWHCDVIHAVETEHHGTGDSSVMYIGAVPETPKNSAYVEKQKEHFLRGAPPPDFPQDLGEVGFKFIGTDADVVDPVGRKAMRLPMLTSV